MHQFKQRLAILSFAIFIIYSPFLIAEAQDFTSNIEKIEVHYSRTSTVNKVYTQDNVLVLPNEISSPQRTVGDSISQLAGVELNGQGGLKQSYNIRGFSRARIKTEVDGIPIITDRRAGNSASFIPPEFITGIYVQKGPSSTLYGSGAMGGVVSLSTNNSTVSSAGIAYQPQDNSKQLHGMWTNDQLSIGLLQRKSENSHAANNTPLNSQLKQSTAILNYSTDWRNIDINASSIFSKGVNIGKSSATFPLQRFSLYPQDDHWLSQIKVSNNKDWQLQLFHHNQIWQSNVTKLSNESEQISIQRKNITDYQSKTLGGLGTLLVNDFTIGFEWQSRRNIKISEQELDANLQSVWQHRSANAKQDTYSAFIDKSWHYRRLKLNFGARYDQTQLAQNLSNNQKKLSDHFTSIAFRGSYTINQRHQLSAEIANAFRFPSVSELLFSGETPRGNTQGNAELLPEESIGFQINYQYKFTRQFSLLANSYIYQVDNYIERYQFDDQTRSYRNNPQVKITGFELTASWQVNQSLKSKLSYQWQQGQDINEQTIDDGLPTALKWSLDYQLASGPLSQFSFSNQLNYRFENKTFGPSEKPLANTLIWHSSIKNNIADNVELSFSILNLTNQSYQASADEDAPWQPERSILLKWQWFY